MARAATRLGRGRMYAIGFVAALVGAALTVGGGARAQDASSGFTAQALTPSDRVSGSKTLTSRLAQTDPALLGRTDSTPVNVVVKLDYDSVATYAGSINGLAATSP